HVCRGGAQPRCARADWVAAVGRCTVFSQGEPGGPPPLAKQAQSHLEGFLGESPRLARPPLYRKAVCQRLQRPEKVLRVGRNLLEQADALFKVLPVLGDRSSFELFRVAELHPGIAAHYGIDIRVLQEGGKLVSEAP